MSFFAKDYYSNSAVFSAITVTAQGKDACVEVEPVPDNETATTVPSRFDCRAYVFPFSIDQKMINNDEL
ncbi:MAG: hypothetical protein U9P10_10970 [Thermodesulfobacteriota bacterium]|nr:hypothetical protein [Thermodesulfobacteriota bacterium]